MKKVEIKLSLAENVKTFVNTVNKYDFDMDLRAGRHVVDAKSILGIFSLDLSRPITLEVDDDEHVDPKQLEALLEDIRPFIICIRFPFNPPLQCSREVSGFAPSGAERMPAWSVTSFPIRKTG